VDYYEGVIRNTEFFTTSELAEKLKMNVQVITRKVQAGEIIAYKIGKDWRIPEQSVHEWLEQRSNRNGKPVTKSGRRNVRLVKNRQEAAAPSDPSGNRTKRKYLLEYILAQFEPNRLYAAGEVDRMISRYNENPVAVRGDLLEEEMMEVVDGQFRRNSQYKLSG
jgi:excisionase family DNA binding protein